MNYLVVLALMLLSLPSVSQTYKTNVGKAETVNVKKGNVTIGKVIINYNAQSPMILLKKRQEKMKDGKYYTEFMIAHKDSLSSAFNVDITFSFSDTALIQKRDIITPTASMVNVQVDRGPRDYNVQISKLPKNTKLLFGFISRNPVDTKIEGLSK